MILHLVKKTKTKQPKKQKWDSQRWQNLSNATPVVSNRDWNINPMLKVKAHGFNHCSIGFHLVRNVSS